MEKMVETGQDAALSTALHTALLVGASRATNRLKLYYFYISTGGTPADNAIRWTGMRATAGITNGTVVTSQNLDSNGPSTFMYASENVSTLGTWTAGSEWWDGTLAQRASHAWYARPYCEILNPATVSAALGMRASHATYTGIADVTFHHEE